MVGFATFLLDLGILFTLVKFTAVPYSFAVAIGFLIGVSINFSISYYWVYAGTTRRFHHGYFLFLIVAIIGAFVITISTSWLVEVFALPLLVARVMVGGVVGVIGFLLNTFLNFRLL